MSFLDYIVNMVLSVVMIVGTYQFYFFTQNHSFGKAKTYNSPIDESMPFFPVWSWVYSFLYYPAIIYINFLVEDQKQFVFICFSYVVLLLMQMAFFILIPTSTPEHWRTLNPGKTRSEKFLLFIQRIDASSNCFPSMHVSVATLTALFAMGALGPWVILFPVLIAVSCIFTKQHYLIDLPFGALLGWVAFYIYEQLIY